VTERISPRQLDTTGATNAQPLLYNAADDVYAPGDLPTVLVPWTTTLSTGPAEMWDDDDNLMMVEVPR
jgi:hypothetical protein